MAVTTMATLMGRAATRCRPLRNVRRRTGISMKWYETTAAAKVTLSRAASRADPERPVC